MARSALFYSVLLTALTVSAQDYAIHAGTLLDGTGAPAQHSVYIVVKNGRIASISPTRPKHTTIKEFPADTIVPGFVDAHGHIAAIGLGEDADARLLNEKNQEQWVLCNARDALASGVTTLRDPGTYLWTLAMRLVAPVFAATNDKPTSLSDARSAIEANLRTPEGKAYDEQLGKEFSEKYMSTMRQCKQTARNDHESFWMLLKLDQAGGVKEVLLSPETAIGTCARKVLLKDRFSRPPRADYWVGIYFKITH